MKKNLNLMAMVVVAMTAMFFTGCMSDSDFLTLYEESAIQTRTTTSVTETITFENAPAGVMASDKYGSNLYSATANGNQVTTGYITQIGQTSTYIQFPINYLKQEWEPGQPWRYEYWNGGFAISNFNNMSQGDYLNQCSVFNRNKGHSGDNFAVAFGYSDSYNDPGATYDKCAKIYLTDATGYVGTGKKPVSGTAKSGRFNSVWVCNTTYAHLVMKDGNSFTQGSLQSQNGWFKVVFVALNASGNPTGNKVEYYLANFDSTKNEESGLTNRIRTGWNQVDLSGLGNNVSAVAISFKGSDSSTYGLNTPAYIAIDDISVTIN